MPKERSIADRLQQLEEIVSHQEHLLRQLNDVALEMRLEFDRMRAQTERQIEHLSGQVEAQGQADLPDEKPPHY